MPEDRVSVVVTTLNSAKSLEKCLASIRSNNGKYKFEIVVVDAGSTDGTIDIANRFADRVVIKEGCNIGEGRNLGVKNSGGTIICFTDSDCVVPEDWVDRLVDGLLRLNDKNRKIVGVGGSNVPWLENPSFKELVIAKVMTSPLISFRARNTAVYKDEREVLHNPPLNSCLFKWAFEEVGGFDQDHGYEYPEDIALDARLTARGYKLFYLPDVVVYRRYFSELDRFARQWYYYGQGTIERRRYKGYFQFQHYGPIFLCLMAYSPLFFVPLGMALVNSAYLSFSERNLRLLPLSVRLTMAFYVNYGRGEIARILEKMKQPGAGK